MAGRPHETAVGSISCSQLPAAALDRPRQLSEPAEAGFAGAGGADDFLYGPGVFHKLPEWMTTVSDCDESDDEDVPYGEKFNELLAGVADDGETTTPPSERMAELSSASDDEAASGTKSPLNHRAAGSDSGRISGLEWPEVRRPSDFGPEEDSGGLVDLDPEEGRRRGAVLLALLAENASGSSSSGEETPAALPGAPCKSADKAPAQHKQMAQQQESEQQQERLRQQLQPQLELWAQQYEKDSFVGLCSSGCSSPMGACSGKAQTHAMYASVVCEAACRAFGSGTVDVASSASGGFVVWLCGWPAAELQRSHQAVLDMLSQALWPYLGQDVVGVEQRSAASAAGSTGARLSGVASAVASTRLTLWCIAEEAKYEQSFCWQYVRSGTCPRGALCRWRHAMPPTYPIDIEVAAA